MIVKDFFLEAIASQTLGCEQLLANLLMVLISFQYGPAYIQSAGASARSVLTQSFGQQLCCIVKFYET